VYSLAPPCPHADFNGDHSVDFIDLNDFIACYYAAAELPSACDLPAFSEPL